MASCLLVAEFRSVMEKFITCEINIENYVKNMGKNNAIDLIKKHLEDKENFREMDLLMIEKIPIIVDILKDAEKEIYSEGITVQNVKGDVKKNPSIEIHSLYLNKLREYCVALGITPKERRKLDKELRDTLDDFDDD